MIHTLFRFQEILSAIGMAQCVSILVYMVFRAGSLRHTVVPIAYFLVLGAAFFFDFAFRFLGDAMPVWPFLQWLAWFSGPPLAVLLAFQVARLAEPPTLRDCAVLLSIPAAAFVAALLSATDDSCTGTADLLPCGRFHDWLVVCGLVAGGASLLTLWGRRGILSGLDSQKNGRERFWIILSLVVINILFLATELFSLGRSDAQDGLLLARTILGIGLAYLAGTSLFRIYPAAIRLAGEPQALSPDELALARRIEKLMDLDKVYQEPAYSRSDLARELGAPEASVSRIINAHFQKTFPQLLNERRVADAQRLLSQTEAPVRTVAEEVGFNSLATFNRVFKEIVGSNPGTYRQEAQKAEKPPVPKAS